VVQVQVQTMVGVVGTWAAAQVAGLVVAGDRQQE